MGEARDTDEVLVLRSSDTLERFGLSPSRGREPGARWEVLRGAGEGYRFGVVPPAGVDWPENRSSHMLFGFTDLKSSCVADEIPLTIILKDTERDLRSETLGSPRPYIRSGVSAPSISLAADLPLSPLHTQAQSLDKILSLWARSANVPSTFLDFQISDSSIHLLPGPYVASDIPGRFTEQLLAHLYPSIFSTPLNVLRHGGKQRRAGEFQSQSVGAYRRRSHRCYER